MMNLSQLLVTLLLCGISGNCTPTPVRPGKVPHVEYSQYHIHRSVTTSPSAASSLAVNVTVNGINSTFATNSTASNKTYDGIYFGIRYGYKLWDSLPDFPSREFPSLPLPPEIRITNITSNMTLDDVRGRNFSDIDPLWQQVLIGRYMEMEAAGRMAVRLSDTKLIAGDNETIYNANVTAQYLMYRARGIAVRFVQDFGIDHAVAPAVYTWHRHQELQSPLMLFNEGRALSMALNAALAANRDRGLDPHGRLLRRQEQPGSPFFTPPTSPDLSGMPETEAQRRRIQNLEQQRAELYKTLNRQEAKLKKLQDRMENTLKNKPQKGVHFGTENTEGKISSLEAQLADSKETMGRLLDMRQKEAEELHKLRIFEKDAREFYDKARLREERVKAQVRLDEQEKMYLDRLIFEDHVKRDFAPIEARYMREIERYKDELFEERTMSQSLRERLRKIQNERRVGGGEPDSGLPQEINGLGDQVYNIENLAQQHGVVDRAAGSSISKRTRFRRLANDFWCDSLANCKTAFSRNGRTTGSKQTPWAQVDGADDAPTYEESAMRDWAKKPELDRKMRYDFGMDGSGETSIWEDVKTGELPKVDGSFGNWMSNWWDGEAKALVTRTNYENIWSWRVWQRHAAKEAGTIRVRDFPRTQEMPMTDYSRSRYYIEPKTDELKTERWKGKQPQKLRKLNTQTWDPEIESSKMAAERGVREPETGDQKSPQGESNSEAMTKMRPRAEWEAPWPPHVDPADLEPFPPYVEPDFPYPEEPWPPMPVRPRP